jgi:hypothetical protein
VARRGSLTAAVSTGEPAGSLAAREADSAPVGSDHLVPAAAARALEGAILLAIACSFDGRLRFVAALPLAILAFIVTASALLHIGEHDPLVDWRPGAIRGLAAMAALGAVTSGVNGTLWFEALRRGFPCLAIALVVVAAGDNGVRRRRAVAVAIAGAATVGLLAPLGTPNPNIDVVTWTTAAIDALLRGVQPYTVQAADIYGGGRDFGFTVTVYPYMPATLLALAPWSVVFGDFRIGLAVCLPASAWLLRAAARRAGTDPHFADVATLALVLHPSAARVIRSGWIEPLIVAAAGAFAWLAVRRCHSRAAAGAFFLQPALKQYLVAPVLLFIAMVRPDRRLRTVAIGALVAAATIGPFLLWNSLATINGMAFQIRALSRPRLTAVSIPGLLATLGWGYPPMWASMAAQTIVGGIAYLRVRDQGAGGLLLGSALALLATFLIGWQAFINYYYYIGATLIIAAVLLAAPRPTPV